MSLYLRTTLLPILRMLICSTGSSDGWHSLHLLFLCNVFVTRYLLCNSWSSGAVILLSVSAFSSPLDSHGNLFIITIIIIIIIIIDNWIHSIIAFNYIHQPKNASKLASMCTHLRVLTEVRNTNNFFWSRFEISSLFPVAKKKMNNTDIPHSNYPKIFRWHIPLCSSIEVFIQYSVIHSTNFQGNQFRPIYGPLHGP